MRKISQIFSDRFLTSPKKLLTKYDNFVFDCDGCLWNSKYPIPGAKEFVNDLKNKNKNLFIVTNAAHHSRESIHERFTSLFKVDIPLAKIFNAPYLTAKYTKHHYSNFSKAYVVGLDVIKDEFRNLGIETNGSDHNDSFYYNKNLADVREIDKDIDQDQISKIYDIVVTGLDPQINLYKLNYAGILIQKGAKWLCTNPDMHDMSPNGYYVTASGSMWKSIAVTVSMEPINVGKPNGFCWDLMEEEFGIDKKKTVMIGDNLKTDISFAGNASVDSVLVMTGVTKYENLVDCGESFGILPTYVCKSLKFD